MTDLSFEDDPFLGDPEILGADVGGPYGYELSWQREPPDDYNPDDEPEDELLDYIIIGDHVAVYDQDAERYYESAYVIDENGEVVARFDGS